MNIYKEDQGNIKMHEKSPKIKKNDLHLNVNRVFCQMPCISLKLINVIQRPN